MRNHRRLVLRRETVRILESELRRVAGGGFTLGPTVTPPLTRTLPPLPAPTHPPATLSQMIGC